MNEPLPSEKVTKRYLDSRENTGVESLSQFMDRKSMQWHERRHGLAQTFLDRFVRQNIAEIDEIPYEEHDIVLELPPVERAIYLELETHLQSLDMNNKNAMKSKKSTSGDRDERMQKILQESETAEEVSVHPRGRRDRKWKLHQCRILGVCRWVWVSTCCARSLSHFRVNLPTGLTQMLLTFQHV